MIIDIGMKKERNWIGVLCLSLMIMTGCGDKKTGNEVLRKVNVAEAVSADGGEAVSFPATTRAVEEVNVSFRVSGPLTKVTVNEGDYVRKGQVLAVMDPRDYQLQLAATQAEYDRIKGDAERVIAMYKEGTTTAQNYDQARYGLRQMTQKLANHRNQLADTRLVSPVAGYVKEKLHEAGETVSAGMPIVTVSSGDRIEVEINVSASDYARLGQLTDFRCSIDALGGNSMPLERIRTSAVANATQLYTVRFAIKGNYNRKLLTPGMSALVKALSAKGSCTDVTIPSSAIMNKDGRTSVFIFSEQSKKVTRKDVEVKTMKLDGMAQVTGLSAGEKVVTTGVRYLTDGQQVEPMKATSATNIGGML